MTSVGSYIFLALGLIFGIMVLGDLPNAVFMMTRGGGKQMKDVNFSATTKDKLGAYITQGYGSTFFAMVAWSYAKPWHNGIDITAVSGAPVHSTKDGTVLFTGNQDNYCPGRGRVK